MLGNIENYFDINSVYRDYGFGSSSSRKEGAPSGVERPGEQGNLPEDIVELSGAGRSAEAGEENAAGRAAPNDRVEDGSNTADNEQNAENVEEAGAGETPAEEAAAQETAAEESAAEDSRLSEAEQQQVQELKEADRNVHQHEAAHLAASQGIAVSGASFDYKRGPDGVNYAVGGEVQIDTSEENTPEKTADKARRIAAAAMAPADPSPQDRSVAARARSMEAAARAEMATVGGDATGETPDNAANAEPGAAGATEGTRGSGASTGVSRGGAADIGAAAPADEPHPGIQIYERNQQAVGEQSIAAAAFLPRLNMVA